MPKYVQKHKNSGYEANGSAIAEADAAVQQTQRDAGEEAVQLADELLDEIDKVLEQNAEEFVRNYVQKGGQ